MPRSALAAVEIRAVAGLEAGVVLLPPVGPRVMLRVVACPVPSGVETVRVQLEETRAAVGRGVVLESEVAAGPEAARAGDQVAEKRVLALAWPARQVAGQVAGQVVAGQVAACLVAARLVARQVAARLVARQVAEVGS